MNVCQYVECRGSNLGAWLLGILRRDECHCLEPLPSREERHYHHLEDHDGRIEGVGLEQVLLHVEHVDPDSLVRADWPNPIS